MQPKYCIITEDKKMRLFYKGVELKYFKGLELRHPDFYHITFTVGDRKKAYDLLKPVIANKKETNIVDWATENLGETK